ncbi:glycoside hydrolase family 45 protein [Zopfia rhizophila CBS 207.26]|uniref:Cellulase n=1 Tax=Zopfia rhizophila CBS 207.26 TaxID=1314779 RepID=A0A6A6DWD3_9PEZI|nr:glycoside hydrolase family 45 protein [Zopfia rhizophila CBS 207.26]
MLVSLKKIAFLALLTGSATVEAAGGSGKTTRYWDCCKGSCGWSGKASVNQPIRSCDKSDNPLADMAAKNGCENGGTAYMCSNQSPWAVSDTLSYGFAAVKLAGGNEGSWCCACYKLTFTSGPAKGKQLIVQATNTGGDLGQNHFDLAMPGGGVGMFNGCTNEWGAPPNGWGQQYGGISSRSQCDSFPEKLKPGCYWRFDWFANSDNPDVTFDEVTCPKQITDRSGCIRNGQTPTQGIDGTYKPTATAMPKPRGEGTLSF